MENQSVANGNQEVATDNLKENGSKTALPGEVNNKKKKKKQINNADKTLESVPDSPLQVVNGKSFPKTPTSPQVTESTKKRKKKRRSELQDNMEVESEHANEIVTETTDGIKLHDESLRSQSVSTTNGSASSKKKQRKSNKFSPKQTSSKKS